MTEQAWAELQIKIKDLVVGGYLKSMDLAQSNDVPPEAFKTMMRQTIIGLFLSVNDIGLDHLRPEVRAADLKRNLDEFSTYAISLFDELLTDEANRRNFSAACESEKTLTSEDGDGRITRIGEFKERKNGK